MPAYYPTSQMGGASEKLVKAYSVAQSAADDQRLDAGGLGGSPALSFHGLELRVCDGARTERTDTCGARERLDPAQPQNELAGSGTRTGQNGTTGAFDGSSPSFTRLAVVSTKSMVYSLSYAAG